MEFEQILEINLKNGTTCTHVMNHFGDLEPPPDRPAIGFVPS